MGEGWRFVGHRGRSWLEYKLQPQSKPGPDFLWSVGATRQVVVIKGNNSLVDYRLHAPSRA